MATTTIKDGFQGGSDNQLKVNNDGSINVNSGGGGSSNVNIHDSTGGNLTSTGGALNVNVVNSSAAYTPAYAYNEITNVAVGIETTITTYTVTSVNGAYLQLIGSSGQNIGEIRIYKNNIIIDKNYLYYTGFNVNFDYRASVSGTPGVSLDTGDIIYVKGLNNSVGTCNFNAKIQVLEVN